MNNYKLKVLHIGWGFMPWRGGGLIEHAEDLMEAQVELGYDVHYFFAGRHYPIFTRPKLKRWRKGKIKMYEIINSPIIHSSDKGTLSPELDISEPFTERFFTDILMEIRPDIIHIHELAGLPSSIIDISKSYNLPIVMSLHDYFPLCPTLKLFDYERKNCFEEDIGEKCVICCKNAPKGKYESIKRTLIYEISKITPVYVLAKIIYKRAKSIKNIIPSKSKANVTEEVKNLAEFFQKRRDVNIMRLNKIDLLIAQSSKVEQIYKKFLKRENGIITLQLTVKHLEHIQPKIIRKIEYPINFITLNGLASIPKGAEFMLKTLEILYNKGKSKFFNLHIFGGIIPEIRNEISKFSNVYYHGLYKRQDLNEILRDMDVGIVPSVWEEALGYVGLELLAKGIPIIGNAKGGIVDYIKENITGWINWKNTPEGMAEIIENIIVNPQKIEEINKLIIQKRDKMIKSIEQNAIEIEEIYNDVIYRKV